MSANICPNIIKNDFICTNAVSYYIRNSKLETVVQMRSNDAWAGYRNDYAWQLHVRDKLLQELTITNDSETKINLCFIFHKTRY